MQVPKGWETIVNWTDINNIIWIRIIYFQDHISFLHISIYHSSYNYKLSISLSINLSINLLNQRVRTHPFTTVINKTQKHQHLLSQPNVTPATQLITYTSSANHMPLHEFQGRLTKWLKNFLPITLWVSKCTNYDLCY